MSESKPISETIAREHFFCPGPFSETVFARDYALFIILRKQCLRYQKTGQINHRLALNNAVIALNSFGKVAVNRIVKILFDEEQKRIMATLLEHLNAKDGDLLTETDSDIRNILAQENLRFNLDH